MIYRSILVLLIFISALHAFAQISVPLVVNDRSCMCRSQKNDIFPEGYKYNFGSLKGECVDSCRYRALKILNEPIEKLDSKAIWIGNFLHDSQFRIAAIPGHLIEKVEVGFEEFLPAINHIFIKFTFKKPIKTYEQTENKRYLSQAKTLVLSGEGIPSSKITYSLLDGYLENYILLIRALSGEELIRINEEKYKHPIRYSLLNISHFQAQDLLIEGLKRNEAEAYKTTYRLFTRNCSTTVLSLLDEVTGAAPTSYWSGIGDALPLNGSLGLIPALQSRQLIDNQVIK